MKKLGIFPFGRTVSTVDSRFIGDSESSDNLNVRMGEGSLVNRRGWQSFEAAQAGFATNYGLRFLKGIDSANATVKEYLTFEDLSGTVKPDSRHVTTGVPTAITNGGAALSLNASAWKTALWRDKVYCWNNSDASFPLAYHLIGTNTSFTPLKNPTDPTVAIVRELVKNPATNDVNAYRQLAYTGVDPVADIAFTGITSVGSIETGGALIVRSTGSTLGVATFEVTLNGATGPGLQDLTNNDILYFAVQNMDTGWFVWEPETLTVTVSNNDGTPLTQALERVAYYGSGLPNTTALFMFRYPIGYTRTDKDNTRKLKFSFRILRRVTNGTSNNRLRFAPIDLGCIDRYHWAQPPGDLAALSASYYWKDSATGDLTGIASPAVVFTPGDLYGEARTIGDKDYAMGVLPRLTATNGATTDKWVLVAKREDGQTPSSEHVWRLVAEYADTALSQYYTDSLTTHKTRTLYSTLLQGGGLVETDILCAVAHRDHMVWGVKGGEANVRHSRVRAPNQVFRSDNVDFNEPGRPQDFTMADDQGENPVQMHSVGDSLIILGEVGVYAQSGDLPSSMTYIKKVGSLPGTAGFHASCVFKSDDGQEGVAYLSADLRMVYFISAQAIAAGVYSFPPVELNADNREKVGTFLFGGTAPTAIDIFVRNDPLSDSLWVCYRDKACVFRRDTVGGPRFWEFYSYTVAGNWVQWDFSQDHGIRTFRSTGEFDEAEYDNSASLAGITGALRDGGAAVAGYWESKTFIGGNSRVVFVYVDRDVLTELPSVTVTSTRQTTTKTLASGKRRAKFGPLQQGTEHRFKVTLPDNSGKVNALVVELAEAGKRTNL